MTQQLEQTAQALVADGKGILAADESSGTIKKRFDLISAESTEESRRDYREMLFSSTEAMKNYISGVILFDETLRQSSRDGTPVPPRASASDSPGVASGCGRIRTRWAHSLAKFAAGCWAPRNPEEKSTVGARHESWDLWQYATFTGQAGTPR